jgi:hypothetical protein
VQEHPVLVWFDLGGSCTKRAEHGGGWGCGQRRMRERGGPEGMGQDRGRTGQEQSCGVGQACRGSGALAVAGMLDRLESMLAIAAGAVQGFIHVLRGGGFSGRHAAPRGIACGHHCGLDEHAPRFRPRGGGRGEVFIEAAARRGWFAIGVGDGGSLREEMARLLHARGGLAEEHRVPREPKHKIHMPSMGNDLQDFRGREMTVTAHQDMRRGPMAPKGAQETD